MSRTEKERLIIFDVDGTLVDSSEGILISVRETLRDMGLPVPADAEIRKLIGPPIDKGI